MKARDRGINNVLQGRGRVKGFGDSQARVMILAPSPPAMWPWWMSPRTVLAPSATLSDREFLGKGDGFWRWEMYQESFHIQGCDVSAGPCGSVAQHSSFHLCGRSYCILVGYSGKRSAADTPMQFHGTVGSHPSAGSNWLGAVSLKHYTFSEIMTPTGDILHFSQGWNEKIYSTLYT